MKNTFKVIESEKFPYSHAVVNKHGVIIGEIRLIEDEFDNSIVGWDILLKGVPIINDNCRRNVTIEDAIEEISKYYQKINEEQLEAYTNYLKVAETLDDLFLKDCEYYERAKKILSDDILENYQRSVELGIEIRTMDMGNPNPTVIVTTDEQGVYRLLNNIGCYASHNHIKGYTHAVRVPELSIFSESNELDIFIKPFGYHLYNEKRIIRG